MILIRMMYKCYDATPLARYLHTKKHTFLVENWEQWEQRVIYIIIIISYI